MKITLFPFLGYEEYTAYVKGDVITINGEDIDLSPLPDGFRLLASETGNKFFVPTTYIERIGGEISFTLFLNVHAETDEKWRDPEFPNILVVKEGKVPLPDTSPPVEEVFIPPNVIEDTIKDSEIIELVTKEEGGDDQLV